MKWIYLIFISFISLYAGWFFYPIVMQLSTGGCKSESVVIYNEPDRVVVSHAYWDALKGNNEYLLSGYISFSKPDGDETKFNTERVVLVDISPRSDSLFVTSKKSFRIDGPEPEDPYVGRYMDPLTSPDFSARVYLYRIGDRLISGLHDRPLVYCMK